MLPPHAVPPRSRLVPQPLKRLILPIWNGGHRFAWRAGELAAAVAQRRFARCEVCGRFTLLLHRRWVIAPKLVERWGLSPQLAAALAHKESDLCVWCGAKLRARRLARTLLDLYPVDAPARSAASLAAWIRDPDVRALAVLEVNVIDGVHDYLSRLPRAVTTDFDPAAAPGSVVQGVRNEDLSRLTFADASFDLVVTSETLEHVPDLERAVAEIRRVLRPDGRHVFTTPLLPGVPTTYRRASLGTGGVVTHLATEIRHPGGDVGYLVYHEFGADLPAILNAAGFEVDVLFGPPRDDDLAQVFVTRVAIS